MQTNDDETLSHIMMNKKTKRLYGRMQHGLQKKQEQVDSLKEKRKSLDQAQVEDTKRTRTTRARK
jgi:pescadillo